MLGFVFSKFDTNWKAFRKGTVGDEREKRVPAGNVPEEQPGKTEGLRVFWKTEVTGSMSAVTTQDRGLF